MTSRVGPLQESSDDPESPVDLLIGSAVGGHEVEDIPQGAQEDAVLLSKGGEFSPRPGGVAGFPCDQIKGCDSPDQAMMLHGGMIGESIKMMFHARMDAADLRKRFRFLVKIEARE